MNSGFKIVESICACEKGGHKLLHLQPMDSLVSRLSCGGGGKRPWCTLFTHVTSSLGKHAYYSATLKLWSTCVILLKDDTTWLYSVRHISAALKSETILL